MESELTEQFTVFIDLLGFADQISAVDGEASEKVLAMLRTLAAQRSNFNVKSQQLTPTSTQLDIKPAVSVFSDHILISYDIAAIRGAESHEGGASFFILSHCALLAAAIAAKALEIGFLIRGGATIGSLHHKDGVVFGKALLDAYHIESRTSHYPRIVLSDTVWKRPGWRMDEPVTKLDRDGLVDLDYFLAILTGLSFPGENRSVRVKQWWDTVVPIIRENLQSLEQSGRLTQLSKWKWFARRFRDTAERLHPTIREEYGIELSKIPWG